MSVSALTAVVAKFAALNVAAKAGIGIAVVVGMAAGAPAVASEVGDLGGDQVVVAPTAEPTVEPTVEATAESTAEPEPTAEPTAEPSDDSEDPADEAGNDGQRADNFGAWVSTQAHEGGVDGQAISEAAHARNEQRREAKVSSATKAPRGAAKGGAKASGADD